nr:hypothetical protein [Tanacetum cinerariifolium]
MPIERHFTLYDSYPLTKILDPMEEPLELSPSVSSSSNVTMLSRLQGRTVADSYAETSKDQEYFIMNLIQNDGFKVTNATQKTKIAKLKAKDVGNKSSGTTTLTNPKVLAPKMYAIGIKSATGASKTASKNHAWIYRKLPTKITSEEKVEDHPRNLNKQNRVDSHLNAKHEKSSTTPTKPILSWSQGRNVADSYAETSKDQKYFIMN